MADHVAAKALPRLEAEMLEHRHTFSVAAAAFQLVLIILFLSVTSYADSATGTAALLTISRMSISSARKEQGVVTPPASFAGSSGLIHSEMPLDLRVEAMDHANQPGVETDRKEQVCDDLLAERVEELGVVEENDDCILVLRYCLLEEGLDVPSGVHKLASWKASARCPG